MSCHDFPPSYRPALLDERLDFYKNEFSPSQSTEWLKKFSPSRMSITLDLGVESGIMIESVAGNEPFVKLGPVAFGDIGRVLLDHLPEDVYYDRTLYLDPEGCHNCDERHQGGCLGCEKSAGQELVFDIDPENFICPDCDSGGNRTQFSFCLTCFDATRKAALFLFEMLEEQYDDILIVYTGRGFHLHILDREAFSLNVRERVELVRDLRSHGLGIDSFVPDGRMHLIRLPHSLHGLVSRIVNPVELEEVAEFDDADHRPRFINAEVNQN